MTPLGADGYDSLCGKMGGKGRMGGAAVFLDDSAFNLHKFHGCNGLRFNNENRVSLSAWVIVGYTLNGYSEGDVLVVHRSGGGRAIAAFRYGRGSR